MTEESGLPQQMLYHLQNSIGYTMEEIAHMAGYSHLNYFRKVLKASKGIRPDKFKKPSSQYGFVREVLETPGIFLFPRNLVTPNRRTEKEPVQKPAFRLAHCFRESASSRTLTKNYNIHNPPCPNDLNDR